jgi:hypothetical protein
VGAAAKPDRTWLGWVKAVKKKKTNRSSKGAETTEVIAAPKPRRQEASASEAAAAVAPAASEHDDAGRALLPAAAQAAVRSVGWALCPLRAPVACRLVPIAAAAPPAEARERIVHAGKRVFEPEASPAAAAAVVPAVGNFRVELLGRHWTQHDLTADDVIVFDCGPGDGGDGGDNSGVAGPVLVWVGSKAAAQKRVRRGALACARAYIDLVTAFEAPALALPLLSPARAHRSVSLPAHLESSPVVPLRRALCVVRQHAEPPLFQALFHGWCPWNLFEREAFSDPREARLQRLQALGDSAAAASLQLGRVVSASPSPARRGFGRGLGGVSRGARDNWDTSSSSSSDEDDDKEDNAEDDDDDDDDETATAAALVAEAVGLGDDEEDHDEFMPLVSSSAAGLAPRPGRGSGYSTSPVVPSDRNSAGSGTNISSSSGSSSSSSSASASSFFLGLVNRPKQAKSAPAATKPVPLRTPVPPPAPPPAPPPCGRPAVQARAGAAVRVGVARQAARAVSPAPSLRAARAPLPSPPLPLAPPATRISPLTVPPLTKTMQPKNALATAPLFFLSSPIPPPSRPLPSVRLPSAATPNIGLKKTATQKGGGLREKPDRSI